VRIALLEIRSTRKECINKDFMGGYGWAFHIGNSLRAKAIEYVKKAGESVPLLEFGYLAAIFKEKDHDVLVVRNEIPEADLFLVHVSMIDYRHEIEWLERIRRERPQAKIGVMGPFAGFRKDLFLPLTDFVIGGEPEAVAYRIAEGHMPEGFVESEPIADLNSLPFPDWSQFPIHEYSYIPAIREHPFLVILSSRGCTYSCDYCPYPVNFKWNERSPENVLDEIGRNIDEYGMKAFLFRDPLFSIKKKRARAIAEGIIERGYKIKWACETRLDLLDEDLIDTFYRSGLRVINVGVESSDVGVLKQIDRIPIPVAHQERIIRHCDKLGIRVTCFYVLGLPMDAPDKIRETIEYAKRLNTHAAMFFLATPFPGTDYYGTVKDKLLTNDFEKMDCFTPVVKHPQLTPQQLTELLEYAYKSYYYRPRWAFALLRRIWKDIFPTRLPPQKPKETATG
jgi:anaerobic magnesium-protoporphyrin IX monomethyl ester cyclase